MKDTIYNCSFVGLVTNKSEYRITFISFAELLIATLLSLVTTHNDGCAANTNKGGETPPQILFTILSMLEYILVRNKDIQLLNNGSLRWILLDEAHTLTGSAATEMALLIRRIVNASNRLTKKLKSEFELKIVQLVLLKRKDNNLTQENIASCLNVTPGYIGQIESPNEPSMYTHDQLNALEEMECSPKDFYPANWITST